MEVIVTNGAPAAVGSYVQAKLANGLLFTSGQLPLDPKTLTMSSDLKEQTTQAMKNVKALIESVGSNMEQIIKCTLFIRDMSKFSEIDEVYRAFFPGDFPARSLIEVSSLPKGALIEIEAVAQVERK